MLRRRPTASRSHSRDTRADRGAGTAWVTAFSKDSHFFLGHRAPPFSSSRRMCETSRSDHRLITTNTRSDWGGDGGQQIVFSRTNESDPDAVSELHIRATWRTVTVRQIRHTRRGKEHAFHPTASIVKAPKEDTTIDRSRRCPPLGESEGRPPRQSRTRHWPGGHIRDRLVRRMQEPSSIQLAIMQLMGCATLFAPKRLRAHRQRRADRDARPRALDGSLHSH